MAHNLKKQIMDYLNTQGFANDGFGTPISLSAQLAVKALVLGVECSPADTPEDYFSLFHQAGEKIRNQDLRACILGMPSVDFVQRAQEATERGRLPG
jgi:hypothetical protein